MSLASKSNRNSSQQSSANGGPLLAIDFGTTRTKVAYYDEQRAAPRLIELGREQRPIIPSVFYLPKDGEGEILVGDDAQDMVESDPEGIVVGLKMEIDRYGKIRRGLGRLTIERDRLAAYMFGYIRRRCMEEVFHGQQIASCSLTVPSGFGEPQRELLRRAAELGGFRSVTLVDEPVAAAQAWLTDAGQKVSDRILVCDVGGGTTDFALVGISNGRVRVESDVSPGGISLGGNDVDRNVWEQAVELHGDLAQGLSVLGDGFRIKLRRIRERLGMERKKSYSATVGSETVKLSVEVFDKDITAFVENVAQETQRYAGKLKSHTAKMPILLVGGGSQMPGLKQALEALKLGPVLVWNHSEFATVLGAVPQPVVKATPTDDKSGRWEEYHKSVKICWADKAIQPGEVEHLAKLKKQLGIGESEAEQIERKVIGKSIVELVTDSRRQAASNAKAKAAMDRTMLRRRISDGNAEAVFKELCQSVVEEPSDDVFEMWREAQIVVPDGNKVLDASRAISRKRGNDLYGSCCLALALHDLGRKEEAQNAIAHLIVPKRDIPLPLLLVQLEDAEGDVKLQQALARKVLDRGRCGAEMWATLAWLAIEQGDASTIETSLDKAYAHNPDDLSLLYAKCLAFLSKGIGNEKSFKHALSALERISHGHWITGYFASQHLIREQDWGGALTRFEKVLSDPRVRGRTKLAAYIRIVRANCFLALDQAPSAMVEVEECLRLDPASVAGLILRGGFRLDAGSPELALHDFELAASLAPDNVDAVMGEANCRLQLGRVEEASAGYLRVWKADPNHRDAMTLATWCCILENSNGGTSLAQLGNDCYLLGRMNSIKLANATRHYISPFSPSPEPQVLLLLDVTSLGGGEDGLALTEDSIWWGTEGRITPGCQKYEDITSVQFNSGSLSINGTAVVQFYQSGRVLVPILEALAALHAKRRAGSRSVRSDLQATTTSALCPKGHGRLRVWDGVPSCWTCGWTETRRGK